ncbi:RCC1/BLIP-II [Delitschia confertaspora ATCC 74209]|uniref:RCC1/BLIP-II n=1 Tax=Delitschia confertaspora ATCC 74209 TaxID=1513339 RepID=A0A9P4JF20_9PLEO|nr:RCC1/BLIP-II [Delitschia confertaspora ATCC 74209]
MSRSRYTHIWALGSNSDGQLGIGQREEKIFTPQSVGGIDLDPDDGVCAIRGGGGHTLLVTKKGDVYSTATGSMKGLRKGDPLRASSHLLRFEKLRENICFCAATLSASAFVINAHEGARVITLGRGPRGELGRGTTTEIFSADPIPKFTPSCAAIDFAAGTRHMVVVLANGELWGWGQASHSELGLSQPNKVVDTPTHIPLPFKAVRAVCGKDFTYVVGEPNSGDHAMLTTNDRNRLLSDMPQRCSGWQDIGATWNAVFVLDTEGRVHCWGKVQGLKPAPGLPRLEKMAVGSEHIVCLTSGETSEDRKVVSWGWAEHGNCGNTDEKWVKDSWIEITIAEMAKGEVQGIFAGWATTFVVASVENVRADN